MTKIAIDIDDTLLDFGQEVRDAFFEMSIETEDKSYLKGAYAGFNEWRSLTDAHSPDAALEAIDIVHKRIMDCEPFKRSELVCQKLKDCGHDILYVTSRKTEFQGITEQWLEANHFPEGEVICSTHDKSQHLSQCQFLIDDRPRTIVEFIYDFTWRFSKGSKEERQRIAFGLWNEYNRALTDIPRVYLAPSWVGLEYYLNKRGLLWKS